MGVVYLAEDPNLERSVAIKTLPAHLSADSEAYADFQREARLLAALNHPNVATIFSLDAEGDQPFLTMEYIDGVTLSSRIKAGPIPPEETVRIGTSISRAVEAAHGRGVIHRDLKPGNVMIREDGEIKVLDFGLARSLSNPGTETSESPLRASGSHSGGFSDSSRAGTIGYMSPEQILGEVLDERTDLFSIGCILFECATGTHTFDGPTPRDRLQATLNRDPALANLPESLPARLRSVIEECLAKDPESRPKSATEVRRALEASVVFDRMATLTTQLETDQFSEFENIGNLPRALSSFVGRERELHEIRQLLQERSLVTLTGAGGCGKTRLAFEVARASIGEDLPDGVWSVELASLTDARLLGKTIMSAVGIQEQAEQTGQESVVEYFASKTALLLLDNCEHLLEDCAELIDALSKRAPKLKVLVTSRESLSLAHEVRFAVPPLSNEQMTADGSSEDLRESDAVKLFVERARQVRPEFSLTDENLDAVIGICRCLDGLPLGLELAASRVAVLEPSALLQRLEDRFRILKGSGRRAELPHQRTLWASIDWSHEQLDETDRILFRRLSVFVGGFTLESVEAVCAGEGLEGWDILDSLTSLVDKSLVEPDFHRSNNPDASPRYRMLESFREYAKGRLEEANERSGAEKRLVDFFRDYVRETLALVNSPESKRVLSLIDADYANVREAMRLAIVDDSDIPSALAISGSLIGYWLRRSQGAEGTDFLRRALAGKGAEERTVPRATALNSAGVLGYLRGNYDEAIVLLTEAASIYDEFDKVVESARARMNIANACSFLGRLEEALAGHEDVLATARELEDDWMIGAGLTNICNVADGIGDLDRVEEAAKEAIVYLERTGDQMNLLMARNYLGAVAYRREQYDQGIEIFARNVAIAEEHGDKYTIGFQRFHRGLCVLSQGRVADSFEDLWAGVDAGREFDEPNLLSTAFDGLANAAEDVGRLEDTARIIGAVNQYRADRNCPRRQYDQGPFGRFEDRIRDTMGADVFEKARGEGAAMELETVVDLVKGLKKHRC